MSRIRVLIAEDRFHEREGFKQALRFFDWIEIVGETTSAQETVLAARRPEVDVILMDLDWYGDRKAGIAAIEKIKQESPRVRFVVATNYPELIENARLAGAEVAVSKSAMPDADYIAARIRDAFQLQDFAAPQAPVLEALTDRELEVLKLMANGCTDKDIAMQLTISAHTVGKHVDHIFEKFRVNSRPAAITVAFEAGILKKGDRNAAP